MENYLSIIKAYLEGELKLTDEQVKREIARFTAHTDIAKELAKTISSGSFPVEPIKVMLDSTEYTARLLFESKTAKTVYAAYSLLTQMRDYPDAIVVAVKTNFRPK